MMLQNGRYFAMAIQAACWNNNYNLLILYYEITCIMIL